MEGEGVYRRKTSLSVESRKTSKSAEIRFPSVSMWYSFSQWPEKNGEGGMRIEGPFPHL